jgi:hypothetical protein
MFLMRTEYELNRYLKKCYSTASSPYRLAPAVATVGGNTTTPNHTMHRLPIKPFAAVALGCLLGFALVDLAKQDKQALARCENRGGSVAECRLVVLGR